jgi:citrate lyase subunit beta/citryl-CoA lyase
MLEKSKTFNTDQVFLDLEDSVSSLAKADARANVVAALNEGGYGSRVRAVRINSVNSPWAADDLDQVMRGAGSNLDCIMLPKVSTTADVFWLSERLDALEEQLGLAPATIGIEVQIEDALGLVNVDAIAACSSRIETIIFGPADFMASINMRTLNVGLQPPGYTEGDAYHYVLMRLLVAGRAFGKQVIDGPFLGIKDLDGLRLTAARSAALGFDGKWVLHPDQIEIVNELYSPSQADYDHAELILDAYDFYTSAAGGTRGAVMLGDEMIDEASRKMALVISAQGRAAGLVRTRIFEEGM